MISFRILSPRALVRTAAALAFGAAIGAGFGPGAARAQEEHAAEPPAQDWTFNGAFGTFDRAAAQRGLKVYREVCSTCHSLDLIAFRHLGGAEGLDFTGDEVKAIALDYRVTDGPNDSGDMFERPGLPTDHFPNPYANEKAARAANGGAHPPDLSLIAKAREGGADYLYAYLTGFHEPPAGITLDPGRYYNEWFPGHIVGMPNVVVDGAVSYDDGTEPTAHQIAWDVTNFLMWAAEPAMEDRKQTGIKVVIFLVVFAGLLYVTKRKVWASVAH
jgi:ubiquinol-cytochrome c reductase cytochrome c1 subunit